ncbi:protein of unknown function (plasmid) [Caballeronia sp. S22]
MRDDIRRIWWTLSLGSVSLQMKITWWLHLPITLNLLRGWKLALYIGMYRGLMDVADFCMSSVLSTIITTGARS